MISRIITPILMLLLTLPVAAAPVEQPDTLIRRKSTGDMPHTTETVIIGNDTVPIVIRQRNYGRFDRGLFNYLFIPKGQWSFGLTASYSEFDADDVQLLSFLKDFDFNGKQYSIKPSVSYFFDNNQALGVKLAYSRKEGLLGRLSMDFDDDLTFDIRDVNYTSTDYAIGVFYRNYVGLGTMKRFAVFNEVDLSFAAGSSRFVRSYDNVPRDTRTTSVEASLNFSPGVCVFIMDNVNFNVSFGVFGIKLRNERQTTDGTQHGSRFSSGANFRFNIFNINFGLGVNI